MCALRFVVREKHGEKLNKFGAEGASASAYVFVDRR